MTDPRAAFIRHPMLRALYGVYDTPEEAAAYALEQVRTMRERAPLLYARWT